MLVSVFATLLGCGIAELFLPWVNQVLQRTLVLSYTLNVLGGLVALALFVGLVSGLYPASLLARLKSRANVGAMQLGRSVTWVRMGLMMLQTAISISLVIATAMLSYQLQFIQKKSPGYETNDRLIVSKLPASEVLTKETSELTRQLSALAGVKNVGLLDTPLSAGSVNYSFKISFPTGITPELYIPGIGTGFNAVENLGLELIAGRDFDSTIQTDWLTQDNAEERVSVIVTESTARLGGYSDVEDFIGQTLTRDELSMRVVGVVKDVTFGNARESNSRVVFL